MPIYEYRCTACNKRCEKIQKISDSPLTTCPHCGAEALTKQISAPGFQFKGDGWYVTDFRPSKTSSNSDSDDSTSTTDGGDSSDASDASTSTDTSTAASSTTDVNTAE